MDVAERVLFVHAHPDDESITTGGTIAALVARGAAVTVLTCTRGELGEVVPAELQYLLDDPAALGAHRETELAAAMAALGVTDHRWLGDADARWSDLAPRRYLDSGMRWGATGAEPLDALDPESLSGAALSSVTADIAAVIADIAPTVVISYDENGGYGHPDHVRTAAAASRAAEVMGVAFYEISDRGEVVVDVAAMLPRKRAALAAHRTQLTLDGDTLTLSGGQAQPVTATESFRRSHVAVVPDQLPFRDQPVGVKILAGVVVLLFGAVLGTLMTAVHQSNHTVAGVVVPWGLVLALVSTAGLVVGLRILTKGRVIPVIAALGVIGMSAVLASPTLGGSVIIPANTAGVVWTYGPAVIAVLTLAWPSIQRPARGAR